MYFRANTALIANQTGPHTKESDGKNVIALFRSDITARPAPVCQKQALVLRNNLDHLRTHRKTRCPPPKLRPRHNRVEDNILNGQLLEGGHRVLRVRLMRAALLEQTVLSGVFCLIFKRQFSILF